MGPKQVPHLWIHDRLILGCFLCCHDLFDDLKRYEHNIPHKGPGVVH